MRGGGVAGSQPMRTAVHNAHGAQINFGYLTIYLTYGRHPSKQLFPVHSTVEPISWIFRVVALPKKGFQGDQYFLRMR
jgi:hypothetical protein